MVQSGHGRHPVSFFVKVKVRVMAIDVRDAEHEELKALNLVLKFICGKPVKLGSVTSALFSLLISQRYQVTAFTRLCLEYLLQKVGSNYQNNHVLSIYFFF